MQGSPTWVRGTSPDIQWTKHRELLSGPDLIPWLWGLFAWARVFILATDCAGSFSTGPQKTHFLPSSLFPAHILGTTPSVDCITHWDSLFPGCLVGPDSGKQQEIRLLIPLPLPLLPPHLPMVWQWLPATTCCHGSHSSTGLHYHWPRSASSYLWMVMVSCSC